MHQNVCVPDGLCTSRVFSKAGPAVAEWSVFEPGEVYGCIQLE
jgi:hypothetical protein